MTENSLLESLLRHTVKQTVHKTDDKFICFFQTETEAQAVNK